MSIWIQALKRTLLAVVCVVLAFAWSETGHTQSPCLIERGQDPLDVLNSGIRHNVWLLLDTSGSMNSPPSTGGASKIIQAKAALNRVMNELVDGAGRPLVNWGFVHYGRNAATTNRCPAVLTDVNGDTFPDSPGSCVGLNIASFVNPGDCGNDSRPDVRTVLDGIASGSGTTPIGTAFSQLGSYLVGDGTVGGNTKNFVNDLLPNQKNFIIHITDGEDTCECNTGGYPGSPTSPLLSPVTMRPDALNPDILVSSTTDQDFSAYNAGLKGEFVLKQVDPALDGSKGNIFVIGFDLGADPAAQQRVGTIAWMAGGANLVPQRARNLMTGPFFTEDQAKLVNDLRDILARIGIPESEVTLGTPIVTTVREVIATHTNTFLAASDVFPVSLDDANAIRQARTVRADHRDNVLFSTTVEVPGFKGHLKATSIYRVTDENLPRTARVADGTQLWDAGVELQDDDPDGRVLLFNRRNQTALVPFNTATVTPADLGVSAGYLGALTDDDARDIVVKVMRGWRLVLDPITRSPYNSSGELNFSLLDDAGEPTWKLFETTATGIAVVGNPPRSPDFDPPLHHASEYGVGGSTAGGGFYWDQFNRRTIILYPSNSGILHAFDGETGAERFGYIPDDAMSLAPGEIAGSRDTLKDFVQLVVTQNNNVINHRFMLSGAPNVLDVFLRADRGQDDEWHTVAGFGRGRGGRFMTALDITDAATDPDDLELLWNRGNREGINDGQLDGLGETWSVPVFGNVDTRTDPSVSDNRIDQWLLFAGGGYGCNNAATEGRFLFAFRVEDGFLYHRASITADPQAPIGPNAIPATPTLYNPHDEDAADNKDFVTRVYVPDVHGRVWKLITSDPDPANWTMNIFAEMGPDHPITAAVTLMKDIFQPNRVFVMGGSGGDRRAPIPQGGFKFRIWLDKDVETANTTQYASDSFESERIFNPEERMFVPAVTAGEIGDPLPAVVFFAASREDFDRTVCTITFNSSLYALGIESGNPEFDLDSSQPGEDVVSLGEGKVQGLFVRDGNLYVSESGGLGSTGSVDVFGDGTFDDDPRPPGIGQFTLQLLIEGFRISPF
jgi:hypothetical protein